MFLSKYPQSLEQNIPTYSNHAYQDKKTTTLIMNKRYELKNKHCVT